MIPTLKFVGRGSAFNVLEGNNSAYIKKGTSLLLIDCGSNIFERLLKFNVLEGVEDVNIIITHNHPDHIGSLGDLIYYLRFVLGLSHHDIKVIAGNGLETDEILRRQGVRGLNIKDLISDNFKEDVYDKIYTYNEVWQHYMIEMEHIELVLKFIETEHYDGLLSYGIELTENRVLDDAYKIFYSGDIKVLEKEIIKKLELGYYKEIYVDVTMQEDFEGNPHLTYKKLKELIKEAYRNKVYCMHLNIGFDELLAIDEGFNVVMVEE